jgi:hypothetical protein
MLKITAFDFGDQMEDLAWPHLILVYKSALHLFLSPISVTIESPSFLSVIVGNSCSPDFRERQACRDVLAAVFRKCESARSQVVRFIHNQFLTLICSKELLEFYLLYIDSLPFPLSAGAIRIFNECVLVLHSSHLFLRFCLSLFQVLSHYISIDNGLLHPTIEYIYDHWPCATVRKQLIFLNEIECLIVNFSSVIDSRIAELIFQRLATLVNLPNIEIAETALNLIIGDSLSTLIVAHAETAMHVLLAPLWSATSKNWNPMVREDAEYCIRMFNQLDEAVFKAEIAAMRAEKKKKKGVQAVRKAGWEQVFEAAKGGDSSIRGINLGLFL